MRVIAGSAKGRKLLSVPGEGTRPITDRVKESLFDIIGAEIEGATLLDLFAGTGSVGIEALSRGARHVVMIDKAHQAVQVLRKNLTLTGLADGATVVKGDAFRYLADPAAQRGFEYIYVAPPQYQDLWARALLALDEHDLLADDGVIIVQIHPKEARPLTLQRYHLARERRYGSTLLQFWLRRQPEDAHEPEPGDGVR
ncbi:MAG: 16S rRNA (guanine(966)-N(2))-methyltransferase RsmD [Anaerolineae bacterium]